MKVLNKSSNISSSLAVAFMENDLFYKGEKGKYSDQLIKAAKLAKNKKLGLWSQCPLTVLNPTRALDTKN